MPGGADFSERTQRLFDAVAARVAAEGYQVRRVPTICAADGKTYLTYVNGLIDQRDGQRIVYMPSYRGAERMNEAAAKVWSEAGYRVCLVECSSVYRYFGTLHCLVNVLQRS